MKKIQLVTYRPIRFKNFSSMVDVTDFNKLKSLDNYDINIFDLSNSEIWYRVDKTLASPTEEIVLSRDFKSIKQMLINCSKAKNIICLPQNLNYKWKYYNEEKSLQIKDMLPLFISILKQIIPLVDLNVVYENSETLIGKDLIDASFYFSKCDENLTMSQKSNKVTTIENNNLIVTTLDIIKEDKPELMFCFFETVGLIKNEIDYPEWLVSYKFGDDDVQKNIICKAKDIIEQQEKIIKIAEQKLEDNLKYKSILFVNSDKLVEVVFEILEFIFDISLSDFNDELKEDFLFKKSDITYLGEIKGVTSNVKYEHLTQLEVHYSKYLDKLQIEGVSETIKKILIINYERKKDIAVRDEINEMQKELAEKYDTLIIDTKSLLCIYEKIIDGTLSKDDVIKYVNSISGCIKVEEI